MSFTSKLRQSEPQYKLVRQVVTNICTANGLTFETVWKQSVSNRECEYFDRFFRRERRRNDPLNGVKKPRTAFSFFTQEQRPKISEKHPNIPFGEVSKLVGQQWAALDAATKAKYTGLEEADKARYDTERHAVMQDISNRAAEAATATTSETAAVAAPAAPVVQQAAPAKKKGGKKATPDAVVAAGAALVAVAPTPVVAAPAQAATAAPAQAATTKKGGKKAAAAAQASA